MSNQNEPNAPNVNAILAKASRGNISDSDFASLLTLMMAKEVRVAEKEAALNAAIKARNDQRKKESENYTIAKIESQKKCKHLKGGASRQRNQSKDPAVYAHTFSDGTQVIKCTLCGARWMRKDTVQYLHRNGSSIPNWTGIGWREASEMVADSSNKSSSSERFSVSLEAPEGTLPTDTAGVEISNLQI